MKVSPALAFVYPEFYPVTGGSSVHGFHLYKELLNLGFRMKRSSWVDDGLSERYNPRPLGILKCFAQSDLVYVRVAVKGKSNRLIRIAKAMGKKVIVEINGPVDEWLVQGRIAEKDLEAIEKRWAKQLKRADAIVTISPLMMRYCEEYLGLRNVQVIKNGGAAIEKEPKVEPYLEDLVEQCQLNGQKIVLWSGNHYPWQGLRTVQELFKAGDEDLHFVIVGKDQKHFPEIHSHRLTQMNGLSREEIDFLILKAHAGLALYTSYDWSRLKDNHGSPLKYYEYLINGLKVCATPVGYWKQERYPNLLVSDSIGEMLEFIRKPKPEVQNPNIYRTWKDVALETAAVIEKVMQD